MHSGIAYFVRRQECLSKSVFHIAMKNVLEIVMIIIMSDGIGGPLGSRADPVK